MNGIAAAFTGRIGKDAEVRTAREGKPWASFPVAVDARADSEAPATVRGRLTLGTWTGRDREAKSGLNFAAWEVQPMGQIGRRKPKVRSTR